MSAPVHVEQVIADDTWRIELGLDPARVIPALAKALPERSHDLLLIRNLSEESAEYKAALARVLGNPAVADALTVALSGRQANTLADELGEKAIEPEECMRSECGNYAVDLHLCPGCLHAVQRLDSAIASMR